jgi:hypothetical protein
VGPGWGLILHGRGGLGDGERPAFVKFEPGNFLGLYETAHSAPTVDKWELCQAGRGRQSQSEQARGVQVHKARALKPTSGRPKSQCGHSCFEGSVLNEGQAIEFEVVSSRGQDVSRESEGSALKRFEGGFGRLLCWSRP